MTRVLIVDDHAEIRQLLSMTFDGVGAYEIAEAANAERALEVALTFRPDVVLLDTTMPGRLDGLDACAELKSDPAFGRPIVLRVIARSQQADFDQDAAAGADAYLSRPFSLTVLRSTLDLLLHARRSA